MASLITVLFCFCAIAVSGKSMGLSLDPEGQFGFTVDLLSESSEPTEIRPLEKCIFNVTVEDELVPLDLVKTAEEVEEIVLEGQRVSCKREEEPLEAYVDRTLDAKALISIRVTGRGLERRLVLLFKHNDRRYSLEPNMEFWTNCRADNAPGSQELLMTFRVFGSDHYLFEVMDKGTEDLTTARPPSPPPPNYWWIVAIVGGLVFLVCVFVIWYRCCCSKSPAYKEV